MFELNFTDFLNPDHELLRAADLIDWDDLHQAMRPYYSTLGRRGKPIRLMVDIHNFEALLQLLQLSKSN